MKTRVRGSIGGVLLSLLAFGPFMPTAASQEALERFRGLSPAERLRLLEKVPALEKYLVTVKRDTVTSTIVERGSVEPAVVTDVVCRIKNRGTSGPATTIRWVIDSGTLVKKGDKLVELDDTVLQEQLKTQKLAQEQADAGKVQATEHLGLVRKENDVELRLGELAVKLADLELKRYTGTDRDRRQVLELKVDQARLLLERGRAQGKAREVQADLDLCGKTALAEQETARVRGTEEELKLCTLVAPRDGLALHYVPEQARFGVGRPVVAAGEPVREGQKLVRVCDLTRMVVNTRVHEALVSRVRPGQRALVRVDAFPDLLLPGQVKEVATVASQQDFLSADVKVYATTVALADESRDLRPDMSAEVRIVLAVRPNVLQIPLQAVVRRGANQSCFVKTKDGVVEQRVVLGLTSDLVAEVREGLAEDDVVLRDLRGLLARPEVRPDAGAPGGARGTRRGTDILVSSVRPPADEVPGRRTRVLSYGLTARDFERLAALPGVTALVPDRTFPQEVHRLERSHKGVVVATTAGFAEKADLIMASGRFLTEDDDRERKNVAVLGAAAAARLFPLDDPVGQTVRLGSHFYQVVGVVREPAGRPLGELDGAVFIPLQTCQSRFGERIAVREGGSLRFEAVALHAILVSVASPEKRAATMDAIRALLEASHTQKDWSVQTVNDP
jgi:multidrug resistance efflux pump